MAHGLFRKNIEEIRQSKALRLYGFFLGFIHVLTYISWRGGQARALSAENLTPLCWSFFETCAKYRMPLQTVNAVLLGYLVFGIITACLFLSPRTLVAAYFLSIIIWAFKWLVIIQDFHLMGNYHYMAFILAFVYLFLPKKLDLVRLLIVGFYLAAGALKLNEEWITGSALFGEPLFSGKLLEASCIYVIYLEFFISLGLWAKTPWIFWAAFVQIIIFHLFSWHIVSFFYPTVMFCVLSIFILARYLESEESLFTRFTRGRTARSVYVFGALYVFAQIAPLFYPGDTALTGEGRIFALNMFDVKSDCRAYIISKFKNLSRDDSKLVPQPGVRIQCDPLMYYDISKSLCRRYGRDPNFISLDLSLYSKRTTSKSYLHLVEIPNFCHQDIHYSIVKHNTWINTGVEP